MHTGNFAHVAGAARTPDQDQRLSNWNASSSQASFPLGVLIFDSKGLVRFCSSTLAHLIGADSKDLAGTCVRDFMPGLPLDPMTEGYNVAFGTFHAAKRCLQSWTIKTRSGDTVRLEGYFGSLSTDDGYRFCLQLHLRSDANSTPDDLSPVESGTTSAMSDAGGITAGHADGGESTQDQIWHKSDSLVGSMRHWQPQWQRHRAASAVGARKEAGAGRAPQVQLLFDREYRISFASSAIEDLLSHNYEKVIGMHVSDLLPEFPSRVGIIRSIRSATTQLRDMGSFRSHARHATGRKVPVLVALREKKHERLISLMISAAAN